MSGINKFNKMIFTVHPAIIAVWAAVIAAGYLIPAFPLWGTGGRFSFANVLNPLSGIFFGPLGGALCSAVGGFIGSIIAPDTAWMGPFTFIIGTTTAFATGCVAWAKWPPVTICANGNFIINGAIVVYLIGTILWFTQEIGRNVFLYPLVVYGLGFIGFIVSIIFAKKLFSSGKRIMEFLAVGLFAFSGLIGGASIGNFFALVLRKETEIQWMALTIAAPIERLIFAFGAAIVGVPLLMGLKKIGIITGPQKEENKEETNNES